MRLTCVSLGLAVALALAAPRVSAAPRASTAPSASSPATAAARIRYVGGAAAYLDRGARDGLPVGATVPIVQRGRTVGTCTVDVVADHSARCAFADAKAVVGAPGDRVSYVRVDPVDEPKDAAPARAGPDVGADLDAARAAVVGAVAPKVVYARSRARTGVAIANRLDIGVRGRGWAVVGGNDSVFVRPSFDLGARAALPVVPGLYGSTALRVQGDVLAPEGERFRNSVPAELYVWDASIGVANARSAVTGAIGRFRPQKAPGMTVIDGALVGFVGFGGALEVGAYGGLVPDLITTALSTDRVVAGAYFGVDAAPVAGVLLLPRARVGLLTSSDLQRTRAEAEAQLQALFTDAVAVGASLRVALPGDTAVPVLDAARVDVDVLPATGLRVRAGWRTIGAQDGDLDTGVVSDGSLVPAVRAAHHGDFAVQWSASDDVVVGGSGAVSLGGDVDSVRALVGPELGLPRLFGAAGGLSLGAYEEPGDAWGRSAFLQASTRPLLELMPRFSWATRVSYFEHEAPFTDAKQNGTLREALLMTSVDAPLLSWLSVRGRAQGLFDIVDVDGFGAAPVGVFVDVGLAGSL